MSNSDFFDNNCPTANKKRRMDAYGQPLTVNRRLYAQLKEGSYTDVELLVTTDSGGVKRLPAHKNILGAMSPVIATKMTPRWQEGGQGPDVIEIPPDAGVEAVENFLKFLYTEQVESRVFDNVELCLEILFLADHYQVENLIEVCDSILSENHEDYENCIKIYEKTKLYQGVICGRESFDFLKRELGVIFNSTSNEWMQMNACTWKDILESNYLPKVEEIELFKGLKRWKDENVEERTSDFQILLKLIRLPLVGIDNFAKFVAPSRELDYELMMKMFIYFAGKGPVPEQSGGCKHRILLEAKNSTELKKIIKGGHSGCIIELNGTYSAFEIPYTTTDLTIRGKKGGETIIKADKFGIIVKGEFCRIEGISIINNEHCKDSCGISIEGSKIFLKNIKITRGEIGISIHGNQNQISNITINDPKLKGVHVSSDLKNNSVSNCSVLFTDEKTGTYGFYIDGGRGNRFSNLICKNAGGNFVNSDGSVFNGFEISGTIQNLWTGIGNCLENINILGENSFLHVGQEARNTTINNCSAEKIRIEGEANNLKDSKAKKISVSGNLHKFDNCQTELLQLKHGTVIESIACTFQLTENVDSLD